MIKVQILIRCKACDGEPYVPVGEAISSKGEVYTRYEPCPTCQGSGNETPWISLREYLDLLKDKSAKAPQEPDWQKLAHQKFTS